MDTKCCPTGLGLGQTDLCKFHFQADAKHPQTTLNHVRPSANSFCRAPQTLCHLPISWRCHIICCPCPPLCTPLAMRNNQRNLVMSCVTWQNKSISDSCMRALQNCMAQIKINIKIYREICKTCPTRCPRPELPPHSPSPVLSDRSCGAKCKLRQRFFLALASSAFCGETLKANYLTCDIMREWIPWGP